MQKISLVADASALVSLASVSLLSLVLNEFNVVVSDVVIHELDEMAEKRDWLGRPIYRYAKKYFEGLK